MAVLDVSVTSPLKALALRSRQSSIQIIVHILMQIIVKDAYSSMPVAPLVEQGFHN